MPELPEVETVVNTLKTFLIGETINNIDIRYDDIIDNVSPLEFKNALIGQTFNDIKRRGKYIIFILDDYYLISHLRMEGKFFKYKDTYFSCHDHVIFYFDSFNLRYNDTRKFGKMYLIQRNVDVYNVYPLNVLGPDANTNIVFGYLKDKLLSKNVPVKVALLDQSIIAGLGNIYVDEVLFMCRLHPLTKTKHLSDEDINNIINNSKIVLEKAIKLGGTTIKSFMSTNHISGRFQNELLVHTKEICPVCGRKIEIMRVGGRGTYICPNCQIEK